MAKCNQLTPLPFKGLTYVDVLLSADTAYTERYMGLATSNDNYRAYDVRAQIVLCID